MNFFMTMGTIFLVGGLLTLFFGCILDLDPLPILGAVGMAVGMVFLLISTFIFEKNQPKEELYALTTEVIKIDRENDVVTCEDFNGYLWQFEGCEDWQEGDICSLLMNDKATEKVFDDEIISARYGGTFEGWN